jgi:hypothetical protein
MPSAKSATKDGEQLSARVPAKSFEKCFRLLVRRRILAQLSFGLIPELIISSVWPVVLFPNFVGTLPDLLFGWFDHNFLLKHSPPWGLVGGK